MDDASFDRVDMWAVETDGEGLVRGDEHGYPVQPPFGVVLHLDLKAFTIEEVVHGGGTRRGSSITAMAAEGRLSKMKGLWSPLRLTVPYCNEDTNRYILGNQKGKYIYMQVCVFITRRKTEASLMNRVLPVLAGPMRSKVLVLISTLSAMVTSARRREAGGGMPLDRMRFSSQSEPWGMSLPGHSWE